MEEETKSIDYIVQLNNGEKHFFTTNGYHGWNIEETDHGINFIQADGSEGYYYPWSNILSIWWKEVDINEQTD